MGRHDGHHCHPDRTRCQHCLLFLCLFILRTGRHVAASVHHGAYRLQHGGTAHNRKFRELRQRHAVALLLVALGNDILLDFGIPECRPMEHRPHRHKQPLFCPQPGNPVVDRAQNACCCQPSGDVDVGQWRSHRASRLRHNQRHGQCSVPSCGHCRRDNIISTIPHLVRHRHHHRQHMGGIPVTTNSGILCRQN